MELFAGTAECTIDDKRRFSVPPKFRPLLESLNAPSGTLYKLVVMPWYGGCLAATSFKRWSVLQRRILALDYTTEELLAARRVVVPRIEPMQTDPEGRLMLDPAHHAWLKIPEKTKHKVVVNGMGHVMEIWNAANYDPKTGSSTAARDPEDLAFDTHLRNLMHELKVIEEREAARMQPPAPGDSGA